MSIEVVSMTEQGEAKAADSGLAAETKSEKQSSAPAPTEEQAETNAEESETSEGEEADADSQGDDSDSNEESEGKDEKPKRKNGYQRKIDKLTKRNAELARRLEALEVKARPAQQQEAPEQSAQATVKGEPNPEEFESHADYVRALIRWENKQAESVRAEEQRAAQLKAEEETQVKAYSERRDNFAKEHADFWERMDDVKDIVMSPAFMEEVLTSENGPEIMYALAEDAEEFARINKLKPLACAKEIGRLEEKLKASQTKKETVKTTKAPKPLSPVGAKSGPVTKSLADMDYEEFKRYRNEEIKKARQG